MRLRHVHSHRGQRQVGVLPAFSLREGGQATAALQLVPLQWLEGWADPALQPAQGYAGCWDHNCSVQNEDEEESSERNHCHTCSFFKCLPFSCFFVCKSLFLGFPNLLVFVLFYPHIFPRTTLCYWTFLFLYARSEPLFCYSVWFIQISATVFLNKPNSVYLQLCLFLFTLFKLRHKYYSTALYPLTGGLTSFHSAFLCIWGDKVDINIFWLIFQSNTFFTFLILFSSWYQQEKIPKYPKVSKVLFFLGSFSSLFISGPD